MDRQDSKLFLTWLSKRLRYKHNYSPNDAIITSIESLIKNLDEDTVIDISDRDLDIIISKYYADFLLDKTEDFRVGYSQEERNDFRSNIKCIISDIVNKNIPTHYIS